MSKIVCDSWTDTEPTTFFNSKVAVQTTKNIYTGILGRAHDNDGLNYWSSQITSDATRREVIRVFTNGSEAQQIYSKWGLGTGTVTECKHGY